MTDTLTADTAPEAVGQEANTDALTETVGNITGSDLANVFATPQSVVEDAPEEEPIDSAQEDEEPAVEPEQDSEPEETPQDSSLTEEEDTTEEEEADPFEGSDLPIGVQKRINSLTKRLRDAEETIDKLGEQPAAEPEPVSTVDQATTESELETLEQQAIDAEDQIDELLEGEPKYDDEGNAYYQVGDQKLTKSDLFTIRKNARNTYRAIPKRKAFIESQQKTEAQLNELPYFSDPEDPYYELAQKTLKQPLYQELKGKIPDAKAAVALMVEGYIRRDELNKKKTAPKKKAVIKSTPPRAPVETNTVVPPQTEEESGLKRKRKLIASGNVDRNQTVNLFR